MMWWSDMPISRSSCPRPNPAHTPTTSPQSAVTLPSRPRPHANDHVLTLCARGGGGIKFECVGGMCAARGLNAGAGAGHQEVDSESHEAHPAQAPEGRVSAVLAPARAVPPLVSTRRRARTRGEERARRALTWAAAEARAKV